MVKGWIVDEEGVIQPTELEATSNHKIFMQRTIILFGERLTPYLLNDTFFTDEILALRKSSENARAYQGELYKRIEANHLRIKELEKREVIMNNEKMELENKLVEAANKKLLEDIAPKPYDLGRTVWFTTLGYSNQKGTIITVYLGDPLHPEYDIQIDDLYPVRIKHDEIYSLERGTCK